MPLYEFKCKCCGTEYEDFHGFHDVKISPCPKCKLDNEKILSAPRHQIMFKAGYSESLGEHCNSEADYKNKLSEKRRAIKARLS